MQMLETFFCDILLPVPIPGYFTYRVPQKFHDHLEIGRRVVVPFGKNRILTGILARIHQKPPTEYEAKYILDILDEFPIITPKQLELFYWIAEYYLCSEGEVLKAALPSGLKLSSESKIQLNPMWLYLQCQYHFPFQCMSIQHQS